jgi:hypothetical protein
VRTRTSTRLCVCTDIGDNAGQSVCVGTADSSESVKCQQTRRSFEEGKVGEI